jgi:CheY-like chemotaxis protein
MAKCKKCGRQQFLRKGLCYKCFREESRLQKCTPDNPIVYKNCKKCGKEGPFHNDLCPECWEEKHIQERRDEANKHNQEVDEAHNNVNPYILVVDETPSITESFKAILKIKDYDIKIAFDIQSALEILKINNIELIFLSENHSGVINGKWAGLEILRTIKEIYPSIEVVVYSSYASEAAHAKAIELGALEYLRVPFLMEQIYELIERARKRRSPQK